jgi:hypothetical protein
MKFINWLKQYNNRHPEFSGNILVVFADDQSGCLVRQGDGEISEMVEGSQFDNLSELQNFLLNE